MEKLTTEEISRLINSKIQQMNDKLPGFSVSRTIIRQDKIKLSKEYRKRNNSVHSN